jgi:hypothetical protein
VEAAVQCTLTHLTPLQVTFACLGVRAVRASERAFRDVP